MNDDPSLQQTCVQPSPSGMQGLLVGDVFFREYVVEFDMTESRPIIGIAPLNKAYVPVTQNKLAKYEVSLGLRTCVHVRCVGSVTLIKAFVAVTENRLAKFTRWFACVCMSDFWSQRLWTRCV